MKNFHRKILKAVRIYFLTAFLLIISIENLNSFVLQDSSTGKSIQPSPVNLLKSDIDNLIDNPDFNNAILGIEIKSADNGDYLYKLNSEKNFIPASLMKLLTTSAALDVLGHDFRFTTKLYLDGNISKNGEFIGNIIIRGSGDPSISNLFYSEPALIFDEFVNVLDSLGIESINGNIIGDDSYFDNNYYGQGWAIDDVLYSFSPQINALSVYDNKIDVTINPVKHINEVPKIKVYPENEYITVYNYLISSQSHNVLEITPVKNSDYGSISLYGNVPVDTSGLNSNKISLSINSPVKFFLNIFKSSLERIKIRFRGAVLSASEWEEEINYRELKCINVFQSPPLIDIIKMINKNSHNLGAECLLKTIGKETFGEGTFRNGIKAVKKYLGKIGIPPDNIIMIDGSGLSRLNLIQPRYIVDLLFNLYRTDNKTRFINTLSIAGVDGTLSGRMTKSRAEKRVYAKTGSMNNICNLAGFVKTKDEETLIFNIMIMNYSLPESVAKNLQDLICMRLAGFSRKNNSVPATGSTQN